MFGFWNRKRLLVFFLDVAFIASAHTLAYLLRFDFNIPYILHDHRFLPTLAVVLAVKPLVFLLSNLYRSLWRYASVSDAVEIFKTVSIASVLYVFGLLVSRHFDLFVRSVFIMDWIILFGLMVTSRLLWRFYRENYLMPARAQGPKTLIVGAGDAGSMLFKEIRKQPEMLYDVVGFVDDAGSKRGMRLHGVPVWGGTEQLNELIERHRVEKVIIAIPSANRKKIRSIVQNCQKAGVRFKTLPGLGDLISGKISVSHIKDVEIEDLLGREPVTLDEDGDRQLHPGEEGAGDRRGGSIGSEICRQVARFAPETIVLLDNAETPLYHIDKELTAAWPRLRVIPLLASIKDAPRIEEVFGEFRPEVVFHAAAYKHVPMMEFNPVEAITNNIGGTRILADTAKRYRVDDFVMISTDKAVNPTNTMGASKRVAELYVQALAARSSTRFTTVRFGNVLGSNGSVIPMFKEQIKKGGPVTVTDPGVVRYFMTIPEATQLVLQAGCLGKGGKSSCSIWGSRC